MKVLVTGAAGYIGSVLVQSLLSTGAEVIALDDLSALRGGSLFTCSAAPRFSFVRGDVRDPAVVKPLLQEADAIVPLAGLVGVKACDRAPELAQQVNVDAVALIMAHRSKDQRVIFANTNSGYGTKTAMRKACTEDTPMEPISLYGKLKCQAEEIVLDQMNTVSFRLATCFGISPGMRWDLLVNDFVWQAMRVKRLSIYDGVARRNFVHVRDVAHIFTESLTMSLCGVFNLGNDEANITKGDLAALVATVLDNGTVIVPGAGEDPDRRDYLVSSEKLRRHGLSARRDLKDGIWELKRGWETLP